ncbi:peptidase associated/transthyretin-like domain-containing protein [Riemerella columbipharyngis]|uniref:Lipoprotein n=1 Tax=Riemerella columbipharyngis TaxID=1071918 RepID=A0A1G6YHG3_9FLAO|nr:carboxypeptidase regulatory-like domain-containing protein [Riemerella columbipharyngis]SDD89839.1 hypothetical protein SAMN05421544_101167 [Riemerella columbipharyngis]
MKKIILLLIVGLLVACSGKSKRISNDKGGFYSEDYFGEDWQDEGGSYSNGTYTATVDYYNSKTGYSATYTLDVEVEDGQVVQIDFPNGGYLDDDHIAPADLDEHGKTTIYGEDGKEYEIQIEY